MNMSRFSATPEFIREFDRLKKKYRSLPDDFSSLESVLMQQPSGFGVNFTILHTTPEVTVMKARLACKSLHDRSLRLIYAYRGEKVTFVYIELYAKNEKENENRMRIKEFLSSIGESKI